MRVQFDELRAAALRSQVAVRINSPKFTKNWYFGCDQLLNLSCEMCDIYYNGTHTVFTVEDISIINTNLVVVLREPTEEYNNNFHEISKKEEDELISRLSVNLERQISSRCLSKNPDFESIDKIIQNFQDFIYNLHEKTCSYIPPAINTKIKDFATLINHMKENPETRVKDYLDFSENPDKWIEDHGAI